MEEIESTGKSGWQSGVIPLRIAGMRQFLTIAHNAFMELVRQPIFLILMSCSPVFMVFLACVPYFGFGDDPKLVKDSVLALMMLVGLFGAVLSAAASVSREIRSGTALAVLSKPVGRVQFILAKYVGVSAALTLLTFVNLLGVLLASRMAYDAYGDPDVRAFAIFCAAVVGGYALAGFNNFFLRRPFVSDAVFAVVACTMIGFVVINFISHDGELQTFAKGIDWRLVPASTLVLFALWILAGLAIVCATRLELIPSLAVCTSIFLLGLMSDYLFGRGAEQGSWWAAVLYAVVPNWQLFWLADALESGRQIPWSYVGKALLYMVCYVGAAMAMALVLFEDRELS
jgi:ABC-type transport system involved in multi-copper enzyme maturation permease subunit